MKDKPMKPDERSQHHELLVLYHLGAIQDANLKAKVERILETDPAAAYTYNCLESPALEMFAERVVQQVDLEDLFDQLVAAGAVPKTTEDNWLQLANSAAGCMDGVRHEITAAAKTATSEIQAESTKRFIEVGRMEVSVRCPLSTLPDGLAWLAYRQQGSQPVRKLVPLRLNFGWWVGSVPLNQFRKSTKAKTEYFFLIPVTESQLQNAEIRGEVDAFGEELEDSPQRHYVLDLIDRITA